MDSSPEQIFLFFFSLIRSTRLLKLFLENLNLVIFDILAGCQSNIPQTMITGSQSNENLF